MNLEESILITLVFYSFIFQGAKMLSSLIEGFIFKQQNKNATPLNSEIMKNEFILFAIIQLSLEMYQRYKLLPFPVLFIFIRSLIYFINLTMYDVKSREIRLTIKIISIIGTFLSLYLSVKQV